MTKNEKGQVDFIDLDGQRFGNVVALQWHRKTSNGGTQWLVQCLCPSKTKWWVWAEVLKRSPNICCRKCRNNVISENQRARIGSFSNTDVWPGGSPIVKALRARSGAIQRCDNPKGPGWPRYGGRGIKVCQGLRNSETFIKIVGLPPFPSWSFGRLENDGNYSCGQCPECLEKGWPLNVAWQDPFTQNNNRSTNRFIEIRGTRMTVTQAAIKYGISAYALSARLKKGMDEGKLIFQNNVDSNGILFQSHNC